MDSQALPLLYNRAGSVPDREAPFSPFYSGIDVSIFSEASLQLQAGLPSATSPARFQHHYTLASGKGDDRPWLTLAIASRLPRPKYHPTFIGNDEVSGSVELELTKPKNIREVKVTVGVVSLIRTSILSYSPVAQGRDYSTRPRAACFS
jgi:hypothetical protein